MSRKLGYGAYLVLLLAWFFGGAQGQAAGNEDSAQDVVEYHQDAQRSGLFVAPSLTWERARRLHADPHFHADVAGPVYAQPLYWRVRDAGKALLVVATEQNSVYALDAETGSVVWKASLGPPMRRWSLPCGNIDPLGITGTPVIDPRSQTLYLDAMVDVSSAGVAKHLVFALSLKDGAVLAGWPLDVEAALNANGRTFRSSVQNQRGALAVIGDSVYIPYGGHFGDCGDYRGWVVAVSLRAPHSVRSWSTGARGGGIWAPGGVGSDGRDIYVATGNTMGTQGWREGEAVIRLGPDLSFSGKSPDFIAPSDWHELDAIDADLGGTNPLLLRLPGATPSELVLALGKDGKAYLLDRKNLGGIGGSLLVRKVSYQAIRTSPARFSANDEVLVAFEGRGTDCPADTRGDLTVLRIAARSPPTLSVAWCAQENGRGAPIVTTTDGKANPIVWAVGAEGDNRLHGFRGDTGAVVFSGGGPAEEMGLVRRFQTLIAAAGRLYVAADQHVYAFTY